MTKKFLESTGRQRNDHTASDQLPLNCKQLQTTATANNTLYRYNKVIIISMLTAP